MDFDFFIDAAAPFGSTDRRRLRGKLLPQSLDAQGPWTETIQRMYWHVESLRFSASAAHVDGFQSVFFPIFCRGAHPEFHNERFGLGIVTVDVLVGKGNKKTFTIDNDNKLP